MALEDLAGKILDELIRPFRSTIIQGIVKNSVGIPMSGVTVVIGGKKNETAHTGKFIINDPQIGPQNVDLVYKGKDIRKVDQIDVKKGTEINLELIIPKHLLDILETKIIDPGIIQPSHPVDTNNQAVITTFAKPVQTDQSCYWAIAPYESANVPFFEKVWQFDLQNNVISIGWGELGDISAMDRQTLSSEIKEIWPDSQRAEGMIWSFWHVIKPGDVILARQGMMILKAVGTVIRSAYYSPGKNPHIGDEHSYFIDVSWHNSPRDTNYNKRVFPMFTVSAFTEDKYRSLLNT